jgi:hypothetical protein
MCVCVERERGERENCLNRHGPPRSRRSPYEPPTVETRKAVSGEDVPELEWCQCQAGEKEEEEEEEKEGRRMAKGRSLFILGQSRDGGKEKEKETDNCKSQKERTKR